jgi:hypothetical protein
MICKKKSVTKPALLSGKTQPMINAARIGANTGKGDDASTTDRPRNVSDNGFADSDFDRGIDGTLSKISSCETLTGDEEGGVGVLGSEG